MRRKKIMSTPDLVPKGAYFRPITELLPCLPVKHKQRLPRLHRPAQHAVCDAGAETHQNLACPTHSTRRRHSAVSSKVQTLHLTTRQVPHLHLSLAQLTLSPFLLQAGRGRLTKWLQRSS